MPVKVVRHDDGRTFAFGRRRPVARCPRLHLKNYLLRSFTPGPLEFDYSTKASASLSQMYLNDREGDCVIACLGHTAGVLNANAGSPQPIFTDAQINALYSAIGGYDPSQTQPDGSNPTDNGCNEQDALNYMVQHGLLPDGSHKAQGWIALTADDEVMVRTAAWLFENTIFGIELPDAWISPFPSKSGFIWDVAGDPDPSNGHCVLGVGGNLEGIPISTWGMVGMITWKAIAKYASQPTGELYALISMDGINKAMKKAPVGVDFTQLIADFDSMGGSVTP